MADTNTNSQGAADLIMEGLKQIADPLKDSSKDIKEAEQKVEYQAEKADAAKETEITAGQQYQQAWRNLVSARDALSDDLKAAEKTEREADTESRVRDLVSQGNVVSVMDILKFMDQQAEATEDRQDAEGDLLKVTVDGITGVVTSAAGVVAENLKDTLNGVHDSFDAKGVMFLLGGGAVGALAGAATPATDIATDFVENYAALKADNPVAEGVDEKTLEGLENEEQYRAYIEANGNGEPEDPYASENGTGDPAEAKPLPAAPEGYVPETMSGGPADPNDALATDDFSELTDPNKILAENEALSKAQPEETAEGGLLGTIVESDIAKAAVKTVVEKVTGKPAEEEAEIPEVDEDYDDPYYGMG